MLQNEIAGVVAAVTLPFLYNLLPNPVLVRWVWRNGNVPMSHGVWIAKESVDRVILLSAQAALLAVVAGLIVWSPVSLADIAFDAPSLGPIVVGLMGGLGWLVFYVVVLSVAPPASERLMRRWDMRVTLTYWSVLSVTSAFIEELWRTFCLVSLGADGHALAITVSVVAFAIAHWSPIGRMISTGLFAVATAWLFFALQSFWALVVAHWVVNMGVFFIIRLKAGVGPFYVHRGSHDQVATPPGRMTS